MAGSPWGFPARAPGTTQYPTSNGVVTYNNSYGPRPKTPPPYPGSQSPHFQHPPQPSPLPAISGLATTHSETPQSHLTRSPPTIYQSHRPYSSGLGPALDSSPPPHAHPASRRSPIIRSPVQQQHHHMSSAPVSNGTTEGLSISEPRPVSQEKPVRVSDPMSLTSILSSTNVETAEPPPSVIKQATGDLAPHLSSPSKPMPVTSDLQPVLSADTTQETQSIGDLNIVTNGASSTDGTAQPAQRRKSLTEHENEKIRKALATIENTTFSDAASEVNDHDDEKRLYLESRKKRAREIVTMEMEQRKRRRIYLLEHVADSFQVRTASADDRFQLKHKASAQHEVQQKDIQEEKERKKDMQRKRRREQAIRTETQRMQEFQAQANNTSDPAEQERYQKQAERSLDKIRYTTELLEGGNAPDELSEMAPASQAYEGAVAGTFHLATPASPEPPKKKQKQHNGAYTRPKKSKEKKQAEKDAAEAAHAAMEKEELIRIAPKEDLRRDSVKREPKSSRSKETGRTSHFTNYDSKGYHQIYEQIWRDLAKKDVPRVARIKSASTSTKQENMRKTAILASKQARKWQERTNKSMKDTQARAKRVMREMMSFWKRNEREERDLRRLAEKREIEDAKKAEADREANRQRRKLNFLISQTEIYSHFVGGKVKTDEIERATDDPEVAVSARMHHTGIDGSRSITLPDSVANLSGGGKVTKFDDLDFDAEDDKVLIQAAMANAQSAIQDAQDKARAFNGDDQMGAFDNSEMNFQNPSTMAADVQVAQPRMLQAQLKEYQLKGLNWLVNLYEQGINGILADEMGLGKTIQSISVMGYLAEQHNIWGPFLVIAPASTLHNWQQEITRFVPSIKVLPYWGNAKDRKVLRKFWDRKHITYNKESEFHVLVTSYQLVVHDAQYFQKIRWQYMILDEAQAIKSSQSSRWKVLLGFHCRNRLLLTGTPIQNNMQELWALLHFIMPTLFDSHDEFSDWFSKDIESHAQSNTKLNQDQLKRLHMILKPFMLRRVKAHVQKELGDKIEKDVFCDLTYRQRAYYSNLRSRISIMDLIEKATLGDDHDAATLMNLVMQFRKVCNHPDLFERADTTSPFSMSHFAETASFLREGLNVQLGYSVRSLIQYDLPRILCNDQGRLDIAGPSNSKAGFTTHCLGHLMNIWTPDYITESITHNSTFSFLRFVDTSVGEACESQRIGPFENALKLRSRLRRAFNIYTDADDSSVPSHAMLKIVENSPRKALAELNPDSHLSNLLNISGTVFEEQGFSSLEPAARPGATAPPIQINCSDQSSISERHLTLFNVPVRNALYPLDIPVEEALLDKDIDPAVFPVAGLLPAPSCRKARYTNISVPSMRRFVTDSGKLAKLDELLRNLKANGHRVLLYFQMTRMIDLMEEYLTYRNYKYCRLDGSTKLEDRRDTVHDFQTRAEIFIFLLSTRAGGLGINLTSADTVIFYDSDWNPTIDSQAMDRAHRLGQTKQVTVYRMITRGTIEERIRKRAMQKEEVQRVVITGGASGGVDFNTRDRRENRTKDIAMWLADDDQAALIEQKEKEAAEKPEEELKPRRSKKTLGGLKKKRGEMSLDDMYHEGEGHFEDASAKASGAATPVSTVEAPGPKKGRGARGGKGVSKKAKTVKQRLQIIDAEGDMGMGGG